VQFYLQRILGGLLNIGSGFCVKTLPAQALEKEFKPPARLPENTRKFCLGVNVLHSYLRVLLSPNLLFLIVFESHLNPPYLLGTKTSF